MPYMEEQTVACQHQAADRPVVLGELAVLVRRANTAQLYGAAEQGWKGAIECQQYRAGES